MKDLYVSHGMKTHPMSEYCAECSHVEAEYKKFCMEKVILKAGSLYPECVHCGHKFDMSHVNPCTRFAVHNIVLQHFLGAHPDLCNPTSPQPKP